MGTVLKIKTYEEEVEELTEKNKKKNKIVSILVIIWFIISIGIFFLAAMLENGHLVFMNFGQYILFFGITGYKEMKDKMLLIPIAAGLGCIIIPLLMLLTTESNIDWEKIIVIIALLVFIIAGLGMIIIPLRKYLAQKRLCSVIVPATIISYDSTEYRDPDTRRIKTLYAPTYIYTYNGKEYKVESDTYSNVGVKGEGSAVDLRINPDNPTEILDPNLFGLIVTVSIGICFNLMAIPLLYIYIVQNFLK